MSWWLSKTFIDNSPQAQAPRLAQAARLGHTQPTQHAPKQESLCFSRRLNRPHLTPGIHRWPLGCSCLKSEVGAELVARTQTPGGTVGIGREVVVGTEQRQPLREREPGAQVDLQSVVFGG